MSNWLSLVFNEVKEKDLNMERDVCFQGLLTSEHWKNITVNNRKKKETISLKTLNIMSSSIRLLASKSAAVVASSRLLMTTRSLLRA